MCSADHVRARQIRCEVAGADPGIVENEKSEISLDVHPVGFEPTPPKRLRPERSALDHSATDAARHVS